MTAALPGALADIAAVAGHQAAMSVALTFGGRELYIPTPGWLAANPEYAHPLKRHLDADAFAMLTARLGGSAVYIPIAARACAVHLAARGQAAADIAARLHISTITVRRYTRRN